MRIDVSQALVSGREVVVQLTSMAQILDRTPGVPIMGWRIENVPARRVRLGQIWAQGESRIQGVKSFLVPAFARLVEFLFPRIGPRQPREGKGKIRVEPRGRSEKLNRLVGFIGRAAVEVSPPIQIETIRFEVISRLLIQFALL